MIGKMITRSILASFVLALFAARASAGAITVDQVLYQSDIANANLLSGTVDMTFASNTNTLSIILTNTSSDLAGDGAGILLTGLGFQLPTGVSIASGTAVIAPGSTGVNFTGVAGTDVSKEWGYDNILSGATCSSSPLRSKASLSDIRSRDRRDREAPAGIRLRQHPPQRHVSKVINEPVAQPARSRGAESSGRSRSPEISGGHGDIPAHRLRGRGFGERPRVHTQSSKLLG